MRVTAELIIIIMVNIWIIFTSISSLVRLPDVVWVIFHGQDRSPPSPSLQFIFIIWWLHRRWCIFNWQASILTVSQFYGGGVSRGEEQPACWPWTLKPQFVNISPCFLPSSLIFLSKPTLWRIRQLVVALRFKSRFKSFGWPWRVVFWRCGIPGCYRLLCVCGRVSRSVRVWLIEDLDPLRGSAIHRVDPNIHRWPNWFTSAQVPLSIPFSQSLSILLPAFHCFLKLIWPTLACFRV